MLTPPPSPPPCRTGASTTSVTESSPKDRLKDSRQQPTSEAIKHQTGRRFRLAVVMIPIVVIILTLCASYSTSRVIQESSDSSSPFSWHGIIEEASKWRMHKRHPEPEPQPQVSLPTTSSGTPTATSSAPSSSRTSASNQPVPVVPSTPPTLPTPFPQPFDDNPAQNFSSASCLSFFSNMTSSVSFRSCRAFSLLLQSSSDFVNAQTNLTLMNSIVWGTCNTTTGFDQCKLNMGGFAESLKTSCAQELTERNAMAVNTLMGLQAYEVMHDVGCLQDPTSNTYCYVNAVRNSNPSDSFYYGLPLGIKLPKTSVPTCSSCTKSIMGIYAAALKDPLREPLLTGLKATYEPSAELSVQLCGAGFAETAIVNAALSLLSSSPRTLAIGVAVVTWILAQSS